MRGDLLDLLGISEIQKAGGTAGGIPGDPETIRYLGYLGSPARRGDPCAKGSGSFPLAYFLSDW